jgi:C1A family cysteine protease
LDNWEKIGGEMYGWRPDLKDERDYQFKVPLFSRLLLPLSVDLRSSCPPVYDQGNLGSCTANAIAGHLDFNRKLEGETFIFPSRLFIYYNERVIEGTTNSDAGATIRDSIKTVAKQGACSETEWPYIISKFASKPLSKCYTDAVQYEALTYLRITSQTGMKTCLAQGYPFVCGISVYQSFESTTDGNIPMPQKGESLLGGHAIMIVGYDSNGWIFRNSWGNWGQQGYGRLPFKYLSKYGSDFWTLRKVK